MQTPYLVTALVSTYNSSRLLRSCLDDLINQTIYAKGRLEIIVIDSGSLENEGAIVAEYQKCHKHIRYLRTERETVYGAWNKGIQIAQGTYITNANTDDAHRNDALELLADALDYFPDADLAYSHCAFTNRPNDTFPSSNAYLDCLLPPFNPALGMLYCLLGPHPLWRKTVFSRLGMFDSSFACAGDYEFQMRFIQAGLQTVLVPEILSLFYQNPSGLSLSSNRTIIESKVIEEKYRALIPINLLYSVNPTDVQFVADAWVMQGNLALTWECAWEKNPPQDHAYALQCYRKALEVVPGHFAAVHNLILSLALKSKWQACKHIADMYGYNLEDITNKDLKTIALSGVQSVTPHNSAYVYNPITHDLAAKVSASSNPILLSDIRNRAGTAYLHVKRAITAINDGNIEAAFHNLQNGASYAAGDSETLVGIGILTLAVGRYDAARELFNLAANSDLPDTELSQYLNFIKSASKETTARQIPQAWLDTAMHNLAKLEFKALNISPDIAPLLLAGASEAHRNNLERTLSFYRELLGRLSESDLFYKPVYDKLAFLESRQSFSALNISRLLKSNNNIYSGVSRLCRQEDFEMLEYAELCKELDIPENHYWRKNWEYYFVVQALKSENLLKNGKIGLGFGVGKEKMISYLAKCGCTLLATDLEPDRAEAKDWIETNQHSDSIRDLFLPGICDYKTFERHVQFAYVDMNQIPVELLREEFDFTWSCCAFEHVGSIELGKQFILNQMKCLKPGGIAVHTTEFNLSSDVLTVDSGPTVIFRKCDIEALAESLRQEGHEIFLDYDAGSGELDSYVDIPPFLSAPDKRHLRLLLDKFITTSIGLFIRKKG